MSKNSLKMTGLIMRCPGEEDERAYEEFVREFIDAGEKIIPSSADLNGLSYAEWLWERRTISLGIDLPLGWVPATLYILIRESDGKILGAIDVRHKLNEHLSQVGGNIGYGVCPSERRKGYASQMLLQALDICRGKGLGKVLVTCDRDNIASARTIMKAGGILENEVLNDAGVLKQRYWIEL